MTRRWYNAGERVAIAGGATRMSIGVLNAPPRLAAAHSRAGAA